ncbi:ABC transporter permease [Corynebacterium sanguinis]|uniref:ABC transporter permease n=1 Tax=Corynebacterium sanguinis TaxID=2594913 RepID=UPI0021AF18BE|nr:ABC transporter permease [Corynebacterium sanguinis]MCT1804810.1 ABC transporter permease [Corynebacterium sanguinis]MCT2157808.1 ABC transporter permease [Corynebacterium sanguinis]
MKRLMALSTAEARQYFRNTLLVFCTPMPVLVALIMVMVDSGRIGVVLASSALVLTAIGFVVYYSALSMATTRRDEKVLKRLRTGEARDWEILTAFSVPLAIIVLLMVPVGVLMVNLIATDDVPYLINPGYMLTAVVLGIPCAHGLALLTSRFTQNAEAAMVTSFPVLILLMFSFRGGIRGLLPDALRTFIEHSPFALVADLFTHGWIGDTLAQPGRALASLSAWAVVLIYAGYRSMRWDTHR